MSKSKTKLFRHICAACKNVVKIEKVAARNTPCPECRVGPLQLPPKDRKPYKRVRVFDSHAPHGVSPHLVLHIYPNGTIEIHEHKRRKSYSINAAAIYTRAVVAEFNRGKAEKAKRRLVKRY